jgi:methyl-accepting chemotaxis protein
MDFGNLLGDLDLDQVKDGIALITEHKDALAQLGKLPDYLHKVAEGLSGAGEQARTAAFALVGDDGDAGVRKTLSEASEALSAIVSSVSLGAQRLADAAESAAKIPLMDGPAERLASAAEEMGTTTEKVGDLATAMDTIGATLAQVGAALAKLGDYLDESGSQARGFVELA